MFNLILSEYICFFLLSQFILFYKEYVFVENASKGVLMFKMTKLRAAAFMIVGIVCFGAIFWKPITISFLENYLQNYCRKCWNAELKSEGIYYQDGSWVVAKPVMITELPLEAGGKQVHAERIVIKDNWNIFDRQILLDIAVINPQIDIGPFSKNDQKNETGSSYFDIALPKFPLMSVQGHIEILQGMLNVHDSNLNDHLPFQLIGDLGKDLKGTLKLWLGGERTSDNQIEITLLENINSRSIDLNCHRSSCEVLFRSLNSFFSPVDHWRFANGNVDGNLKIHLPQSAKAYVTGEATFNSVIVENTLLNLRGEIPEMRVQIKESVGDEIIGSLDLTQKASIKNGSWEIVDIIGNVSFEPGNKKTLSFDGLLRKENESLPIHLSSLENPDIELQLLGRVNDLLKIAPEALQTTLIDHFDHDTFSLQTIVKMIPNGIRFDGIVEILEPSSKDPHKIEFNTDLMLSNFSVENGRFSAKNLPLNKFLGAFVSENISKIDGLADVKGQFDSKEITFEYKLHNFLLDHSHFIVWMDQPFDPSLVLPPGNHSWNFQTGVHRGSLPVHNASYTDKKTGLCFTGINSKMTLEQDKLHAVDVETFCGGVYLSGTIDVDFSKILDGYANVDIHSHTMEGKVSHLKELASKFHIPAVIQQWPFEGNVALHRDGAHFRFSIEPENVTIDSHVEGTISEGILNCCNNEIMLRDLSSNFEYNDAIRTLEFNDIQGSLLIGKPQYSEEYVFSGDHIRLVDSDHTKVEFDLWIGDKTRDVIRVAGKTDISKNADRIEFDLDKTLTHFGEVHPETFQLILRDWSHVDTFHLIAGFQLKALLQDILHFTKVPFSKGWLKKLNNFRAEGDFKIDVQYDDKIAQIDYDVVGHDVLLDTYHFKKCLLNGRKKDNSWMIDQLTLDELSFAADISKGEDSWIVNFLGLRYGNSVLAGLEGEYFPHDHMFEAKINLLDVELSQMHEWPGLKPFVARFHPRGKIHGTGSGKVKFSKEHPRWIADASMKMALKGCETNGMRIQDVDNISCSYTSNRGIEIVDLTTTLQDSQTNLTQACMRLRKADYDFAHHEIIVEGLQFSIPAMSLPWISAHLQHHFSDIITPKLSEVLRHSKQSGDLEGSLDVTRAEQHRTVRLALADGEYQFNNSEYNLKNFIVEYDPLEFRVRTHYTYQNHPVQVFLRTKTLAMDAGELLLSGENDSQLLVNWYTDPQHGLTVQRAEGHLDGISVRLSRPFQANINAMTLNGEVAIDLNNSSYHLPSELRSLIQQWQIGGKYILKGDWSFSSENLLAWEDKLSFNGTLAGEHCQFNGYQISNLNSHLAGTVNGIFLNHLEIRDACGKLESENFEIMRDAHNHWTAHSKLISISQFKPNLLKAQNGSSKDYDSAFMIKQLDVHDFSGDLSLPHSFVATGSAHVVNPPKPDHPFPIVNVALEKAAEFGVDLSALNPVSGTIEYEMKQGRIYLMKFKDMYSNGKVSRFYLPKHDSDPAYIDFDGNVHLKVRMKQNNLLFKLAELFTITIDGTVKQPKFSLFKENER